MNTAVDETATEGLYVSGVERQCVECGYLTARLLRGWRTALLV
jgi:hypothetical protein